jgi:hypothetical protein
MRWYKVPAFLLGIIVVNSFLWLVRLGVILTDWAEKCEHQETLELGGWKQCTHCGITMSTTQPPIPSAATKPR